MSFLLYKSSKGHTILPVAIYLYINIFSFVYINMKIDFVHYKKIHFTFQWFLSLGAKHISKESGKENTA